MYWSRTGNILDLGLWLVLTSAWSVGGWLLVKHVFHLRAGERLFSGLASGWLLFLSASSLIGQLVPVAWAFWLSAGLVLAGGVGAAWVSSYRPRIPMRDFLAWRQILLFVGLVVIISLVNRGLGIFDDYANLPLVSTLAAGDIPPYFYMDSEQVIHYHHGLHLFAASLVRIGGFFPWSAFDVGRTLSLTLAVMLAWRWFRQLTNHRRLVLMALMVIIFGEGSRWLMLFLPADILQNLSAQVQLMGSALQSGPDLAQTMLRPWNIEGSGPYSFPFAFANGIFPPLSMALGGSGALAQMTIFLLLILGRRQWQPLSGLLYGLILASLAITADHLFIMAWGGILLAVLFNLRQHRTRAQTARWLWVLLPGAILAPLMGGVLTGLLRRLWISLSGSPVDAPITFTGAALRWPPAFVSAHLGSLSISIPKQILVALFEIGPVLLLAPLVTFLIWNRVRSGRLISAGLSIGAIIGFLVPLFISLEMSDRDVSRIIGTALFIWLVLGTSRLIASPPTSQAARSLAVAGFLITTLGGLALLPTQLIAITQPQLTTFAEEDDALLCKAFWDKLEKGAYILAYDYPSTPVTLFGRGPGHAYLTYDQPYPAFQALLENPDPLKIALAGYRYVYLDKKDWQNLTPAERQAFEQPCVRQLVKIKGLSEPRFLFDVHACRLQTSKP